MGGKSKSRSKQESVSGPSTQQTVASNLILEALVPGSTGTGTGYRQTAQNKFTGEAVPVGDLTQAGTSPVKTQNTTGMKEVDRQGYGVTQGRDIMSQFLSTVPAYTSSLPGDGGPVVTQNPAGLQPGDPVSRLLPDFDDAKYVDFFDKYDSGTLSESANQVVTEILDIVNNPVAASQEQMAEIYRVSNMEEALSVPEPPVLTEVVGEIMAGLPQPMTNFMNNIFIGGTQEAMDAELENLSQKLLDYGNEVAGDLMDTTLGKVAAQTGGAMSGSALAAIQEGVVDIAKGINTQIAQARLQAMETLVQARNTGVQLITQLLDDGQQQQAMELSRGMKDVELALATQQSKLNAHTQMQMQMNQSLQNILPIIVDEERQVEANKERTQQFIYNLMAQLATAGPGSTYSYGQSRSSSFNIGGNIGMTMSVPS